jgi:plastocyanin
MALAAATLLATAPALAGTISGKVQVTDKGGRPLADLSDVVVYVTGSNLKPKPARVSMVMRGKQFVPHVAAVPVGSTVEFPNHDPIFHNAFSVSGENRFDLALYKRPKSASWTFQHPGVARVYCNIHPQMSAIVLVTDSPFLARAAADGTFRIDDVPAGRYVVKAWHERGGEQSLQVSVTEAGPAQAQFALDASGYKRVQHKNKFGKDYASDEKY